MVPPISVGNRRFDIMPALINGLGQEMLDYGLDPAMIYGAPLSPAVRSVPPATVVPMASRSTDLPPAVDVNPSAAPVQIPRTQFVTQPSVVVKPPALIPPERGIAPLDLSGVPNTETYPTREKYLAQPTIDQGRVAREQGRASLRAGLIGLLLGGGMGALTGAVGAAQGVQQGAESEYQRQQQEVNARNQMMAQKYQEDVARYGASEAARRNAIAEASLRQTQAQNVLNAKYEQQLNLYNQSVAEQDAARRALSEQETRRISLLNALSNLAPGSQKSGMEFFRTGVLPEDGIAKAPKAIPPLSASAASMMLSRAQNDFAKRSKDPREWATVADALRKSFLASPDPSVQAMAAMIPEGMPKDLKQVHREKIDALRLQRAQAMDNVTKNRIDRQISISEGHLALARSANDLAYTRENRIAAGRAATPSENKNVRDLINSSVKEIQDIHTELSKGDITNEEHDRLVDSIAMRVRDLYNRDPSIFAGPLYVGDRIQFVTLRDGVPGAARTPAGSPPAGSATSRFRAVRSSP